MIARTLGPYDIVAELGRGGMATVYKAHQRSLERHVALKVLDERLVRDQSFVRRFQAEARTAASLEHPNIVPIYEVGEAQGVPYIAMRLIEGETLAGYAGRNGPLALPAAVALLAQVADALDFAHGRGVVHRDVKPSNILVDTQGWAYLMDFGIARATGRTRLTRVGALAGTPEYMAPEQAQGQEVDHRADLYALGIIAYELLTGRVPFQADSEIAVLHQQVHEPPPSVRAVRPDLPVAGDAAIRRMLAKRANDRYPSGAAFLAALGSYRPISRTRTADVHRTGSPLLARYRGKLARQRAWLPGLAAGMALFVIGVVLAAGQALQSSRGPANEARETNPAPAAAAPVPEAVNGGPISVAMPDNPPTPTLVAGPAPLVASEPSPVEAGARLEEQVLTAVDQANAAWAESKWTLDPSSCQMGLAGRELQDCIAELNRLRGQRQARWPVMTAFEVTSIDGERETRVYVHTRESWYSEVYDLNTRRLLHREPVSSYVESYTVDYIGDRWVVTYIELETIR